MSKFRKKPVVIEAWRWVGNGFETDAPDWIHSYKHRDDHGVTSFVTVQEDGTLLIPTLEGDHTASIGDWIIQGVKGEIYPCKPDIFEETYESVRPHKLITTPWSPERQKK